MSESERAPDLDADALAMLACYRRAETLPDGLEDRVWQQLDASSPDVAAAPDDLAAARGAARGRWGLMLLVAAAAVGLVVLGLRAAAPDEANPKRDGELAPYHPDADAASGAAAHRTKGEPRQRGAGTVAPPAEAVESEANTATPDVETPTTAEPKARSTTRPRPVPAEPPDAAVTGTLAAETRMLQDARDAMGSGAPARALAILGDAKRRFPGGLLIEERQALEVLALCAAGKTKAGRAKASVFLSKRPRSALAPRVRAACTEAK